MTTPPKKLYLVWQGDEENDDNDYFDQYNTLEDAVSAGGDGTEVYLCEPKLLGTFKRKVAIVKARAAKKPKKK